MKSADKVIVGEYYVPHLAHVEHGAAGRGRRCQGRQGRDLGAGAKPGRHARGRRQDARHPRGQCHRQRHAARRRLRAQVEMRLCAGGGAALEGARRAGQGAVDARGRCPARLPPHGFGGADRGRPRQERQGDRVAAPQRRAEHRFDLRGRSRAPARPSSSAWDSSTCRSRSPTSSARIREAAAHTRIGWFRSVSNIPRAFAVQSMVGELAHATGRDQKDMLLELIGSPRILKLELGQGLLELRRAL